MPLSKKDLGNLIKEARQLKSKKSNESFTQADLARCVNKSRSYIGDIEAGRTYPNYMLLSEIAKACEVSLNFFEDAELPETDNTKITDVKQAMDLILAQPGLMLNGEALSDESKIALANAIQLGLQYAEQMQKKERENK